MADRLDQIEEDIGELKAWTGRHDDSHTADTKLLASIVEKLAGHEGNHHGTLSNVKQGGAVGIGVTLLYVAVELVRQFFL